MHRHPARSTGSASPARALLATACLATACLAAGLAAQQPGPVLAPLGVSHPPSVTAPQVEVIGQPLLGAALRVDVVAGQPGQFGFLALGQAALTPVIIPGGHPIHVPAPLLVQPFVLNAAGQRTGAFSAAPLPAAALGVDLGVQAALFDALIPAGFVTTRTTRYRLAQPTGDPAFLSPRLTVEGARITRARDLNNDGLDDLLLVAPDGLFVALAGPGGDYLPRSPVSAPAVSGVRDLAVGDIDGDGNLDVVAAIGGQAQPAPLVLFSGVGDGTFQPPTAVTQGVDVRACAMGDLDGDGLVDIAFTQEVSTATLEIAAAMNASGAPAAPIPLATVPIAPLSAFRTLTVADVAGDARPEILLGDSTLFATADLRILGAGAGPVGPGSFTVLQGFAVAAPLAGIDVADLDGAGRPDLALRYAPSAINPPQSLGAIHLADASGSYQAAPNVLVPGLLFGNSPIPGQPVLRDLNGDSLLDVAFPSLGDLVVVDNAGNGQFGNPRSLPMPAGDGSDVVVLENSPLGEPALLIPDSTASGLVLFQASGEPIVGRLSPGPSQGRLRGCGDFNGDGLQDVLTSGADIEPQLDIWLGHGDGTFAAPLPLREVSGGRFWQVELCDLDRDGRTDLLALRDTKDLQVWLGTPSGLPTQGATVANLATLNDVFALGDVTGDGIPDLLHTGDVNGSPARFVRAGLGDGTFGPATFQSGLERPGRFTLADVNGDRRPDEVARFLDRVSVAHGLAGGGFGPRVATASANPGGLPIKTPIVRDFNDDGIGDVLAGGLFLGSPSTAALTPVTGSGAGDLFAGSMGSPTVADYDGDGLPEAARAFANSFVWLLDELGRPGESLTSLSFAPVGRGGLGAADFDQDGLPDLVGLSSEGLLVYPNQRGGRK